MMASKYINAFSRAAVLFAVLLFVFGVTHAMAGGEAVRQKQMVKNIQSVAANALSARIFAEWLKTKPGVMDVEISSRLLVSLPAKCRVFYRLNGETYSLQMAYKLPYRIVSVKAEMQRMDKQYELLDRAGRGIPTGALGAAT